MAPDTIRAVSPTQGGAPMSGPADDLWLLAHDSVGVGAGLRLHERAHNTGLAACLLGELWLAGWVGIDVGLVSAIDRRPVAPEHLPAQPPAPSLLEQIWGQIAAEPWRHPVRTWLAVLGQTADQQVADRLVAAGQLRVERSRRSARVVPSSPNVTGIPAARLRVCLQRQHPLSPQDMVLLSVVDAVGLSGPLLDGVAEPVRTHLPQLLDHVWREYPPVADLARGTQTVVASATLLRGTG